VSNALTCKKFIKQQGWFGDCNQDPTKVGTNKGFWKFRRTMDMNFQKRAERGREHINCGAIMDHDHRPRY
jgi:hypothetical protein